MVMRYADPFEALFAFQRALEKRLSSDWLGNATAGIGTYPPVNVFQQATTWWRSLNCRAWIRMS
jgi:hypothetical protein